ncbi:hypothetical protein HY251_03190 [bacterium]|nr:hypothetical protein [bacterium]
MKLRRRPIEPTLWDLVDVFFQARRNFKEVYELYESRVKRHAAEKGVHRKTLRLTAEEVSKLFDFAKLESLRNGPIDDLRLIAHARFRRKGSTDKLDRLASEIYHELSILKEEQYKVSTFAPEYHKRNELDDYESILDEVHEEFPKRVNHILELFDRARHRLEAILRRWREDKVLVRSIALFGEKTVEGIYEHGVDSLYAAMYEGGPLEGHLRAAQSFAESGFAVFAREEAKKAVAAAALPLPEDATSDDRDAHDRLAEKARHFQARIDGLSPAELVEMLAEHGAASDEGPIPPAAGSGTYELTPESADELVEETEAPPPQDRDTESPHAGARG